MVTFTFDVEMRSLHDSLNVSQSQINGVSKVGEKEQKYFTIINARYGDSTVIVALVVMGNIEGAVTVCVSIGASVNG